MCFRRGRKAHVVYHLKRLECQMAAFDDALAVLDAKLSAVLAKLAGDQAALDAANAAVLEANARAAAVVAEDAAADEAVDQSRADAINAIAGKLDGILAEAPVNPTTESNEL